MSKLIATVRHDKMSSHYCIGVSDDLTKAKRQATREFGQGYIDHEIVIIDTATRQVVCRRLVGDKKWSS